MKKFDQIDLFGIKQKFLSEIPHPRLIKKEIKKLMGEFQLVEGKEILDAELELVPFLESYLSELMSFKLKVSNSKAQDSLAEHLLNLYSLQGELFLKLSSYVPKKENLPMEHLKMSTSIDAFLVLRELKSSSLIESEISEYIWQQISSEKIENFSLITNECLRAFKIKLNG